MLSRRLPPKLTFSALATVLVAIAVGVLLLQKTDNARGTPTQQTLDCPRPGVAAPARVMSIINKAAAQMGVCLVAEVRFGAPDLEVQPLAGYPGDQWLYLEVRVTGGDANQVEADWEAARLAGEVRNLVAAANLPTPFGYSIIRVLPDGAKLEPIDIVIGAAVGMRPSVTSDTIKEEARVRRAAGQVGLSVRNLTFRGQDLALIVRVSAARAPTDVVAGWPALVQGIVGNDPVGDWLIEIEDRDGSTIKAAAGSVATAGVVGWTRPDLREAEAGLLR